MRRVTRIVPVVIAALGVGLSFAHPFGAVKSQASMEPLLAGAEVNAGVMNVFERSCQNCHSERTHWPWYSYVAPFSWLIEADVHAGRSHMNLSHWSGYSVDRQAEILTRLGAEVRNRKMPLPRYLQLHPEAGLSDAEVEQLYTWAHKERSRLKTMIDSNSNLSAP